MPLYEKSHSWGEFVFAGRGPMRMNRQVSIRPEPPSTPAPSRRLLLADPDTPKAAMR